MYPWGVVISLGPIPVPSKLTRNIIVLARSKGKIIIPHSMVHFSRWKRSPRGHVVNILEYSILATPTQRGLKMELLLASSKDEIFFLLCHVP